MQKRITWLDAMKGFMIIFVVLCHSLVLNKNIGSQGHIDSITMYGINIFIMPCFFAISGFLYKRIKSWQQYKILWYKKFFGLFIPYLIFSIILHYYMHAQSSVLSVLYQPIFLLWFLFALFFIFIIAGTLDLMHVSISIQFILYLVAMITQTKLNWWIGPNYDMNPVACTLGYIAFFYVGYLMKRYFKVIKLILNNKLITLALFIILLIGTISQAKYTGVFPYNTDQISLSDIVTKMWSIPTFFSLFIAFQGMHPRWLNIIGRSSLVVYLVHYFALHALFTWILADTMLRSPVMQTGLRFMAGMLGALAMMFLVKHIKSINLIFYPRHCLDKLILH